MDYSATSHPISSAGQARPLDKLTRALPVATAVLGVGLTLLLVARVAPADGRLAELILQRGWTQPLTLGLFFWGLGHVIRRFVLHSAERRAVNACSELLWDGRLSRDHVSGLIGSLHPLRGSLAGQVLIDLASYFRNHRPTRDEVLEVANLALDRAHDRLEVDEAPLLATLWLLPLSGFIGTVLGMAAAISSFDEIIASLGGDLSALTPAVAGLATAFDTTLLALVLVVPLKLAQVTLDGRDRRLLDLVDQTFGAGLVRELDLAVLAQQSPAEVALERSAQVAERIEASLLRIDAALAAVGDRFAGGAELLESLQRVAQAADQARDALPAMKRSLAALEEQGERPLTVVREPRS